MLMGLINIVHTVTDVMPGAWYEPPKMKCFVGLGIIGY